MIAVLIVMEYFNERFLGINWTWKSSVFAWQQIILDVWTYPVVLIRLMLRVKGNVEGIYGSKSLKDMYCRGIVNV